MYWDGYRWIDPRQPKPTAPPRRHRVRDWLATGVMVLAIVALVYPGLPASGESPRIALSPNSGSIGSRVVATITGLEVGIGVQLTWDGSLAGMPAGVTSRKGEVRLRLSVPAGSVGVHEIAALATTPARGNPNRAPSVLTSGFVLAVASFTIASTPAPPPAATPSPTLVASAGTPTPAPSIATTASPTQAPSMPAATPVPPAATPVPPAATPAPVPAAPTPAPVVPAPAPGCTRMATADASGASDVTGTLQSFINGSPNGSTICLAAGGQYRVDGRLSVNGKTGLTINGQGARIFGTVRMNGPKLSFGLGSGIAIRNLTVEGFHPEAGTSNAYVPGWEHGHAIAIYGSRQVTLGPNLTLRNISGDGVYITGSHTSNGGFQWADGVTITACRIERNGRMGVALTDGARNVVVSGCVLDQIAMYAFDIEPNGIVRDGVTLGAENVRFSDNSIGRYTIDPQWAPLVFAGTGNGFERNVEFSRNVVTGGPLRLGIWNKYGNVRSDFRIVDNRSTVRVSGPTMEFLNVSGLTVTGNTQPLSAGVLVSQSGCTGVTILNNPTG